MKGLGNERRQVAERAAGQEGWGGPRSTSRQTAAVTLDTLSQTGRWGPEQAAEGGRHLRQRQQLENNWENKDERKGGRDAETRDLGAMSHQTARTHLLLRPLAYAEHPCATVVLIYNFNR